MWQCHSKKLRHTTLKRYSMPRCKMWQCHNTKNVAYLAVCWMLFLIMTKGERSCRNWKTLPWELLWPRCWSRSCWLHRTKIKRRWRKSWINVKKKKTRHPNYSIELIKIVKHWSNNRRGTWKIIKKAQLGEDGL